MEWKTGIAALAVLLLGAGAVFAFGGMGSWANGAFGMMGGGQSMPGGMMGGMGSGNMLAMHNSMHGTDLTQEQFDELHQGAGGMDAMHGGRGTGAMGSMMGSAHGNGGMAAMHNAMHGTSLTEEEVDAMHAQMHGKGGPMEGVRCPMHNEDDG